MIEYRYFCDTCPFQTSHEDAKRGHETYLERNPEGWLGHGETHVMLDREATEPCKWCGQPSTGARHDFRAGSAPASAKHRYAARSVVEAAHRAIAR